MNRLTQPPPNYVQLPPGTEPQADDIIESPPEYRYASGDESDYMREKERVWRVLPALKCAHCGHHAYFPDSRCSWCRSPQAEAQ